jgi:hypothetical protein
MCFSVPGASIRALRGMLEAYYNRLWKESYNFMDAPSFHVAKFPLFFQFN